MKYITYKIHNLGGNKTPIAVAINDDEKIGYEVFFDADSLVALDNVRVNNCGKIRKDAIIITPSEHYEYNWKKLNDQYYDKHFT